VGKQKHPSSLYESEVSGEEKWLCSNIQYDNWNPKSQNILNSKHCHDNQLGYQDQQLWLVFGLEVQLPDQRSSHRA
jgi:hypothetical protein